MEGFNILTHELKEQVASVMAALTKTAVTEICKVIDSEFTDVRREVCLRQSELEALRTKVLSLTSEGRTTTASVGWNNVCDAPPRRSVAVPVSSEQGVEECSTLMDTQPKGGAVVELIVKVEVEEEHGTQETNQSPGEDPAIGCSASGGSFPKWGAGSSHQGAAGRRYGECCLEASNFSPSQSDTSTELRPRPHRADQLHAHAAPLRRHSSALLPAALGPVKKEEEGEGVDTPEVERADTAGQTHGHTPLQSHLSELDAHTHTPTLVQKHEVQQGLEHGQGGGKIGEEERGLFRGPTHGKGFPRYQQLQAHGEERAGKRGTRCGTTPANAAIHRKCPAKEYLNCSGEKHWHSEMEEKPTIESYHVQDSLQVFTLSSEQEDLNTYLTHTWDSPSSLTHTHLTHSQDSTSAFTHSQEPEGLGYLQQEEEKVDQNLHTIPLFCCSSCPKSFSQETALKRHQRSHSDYRQFGCDVCGKSFKLRCNLQQHKLLHSGSKPFACHHCGKRFTQASAMKSHQRIHTGERPYLCTICGQTFNQHSHLTRHQKRLHQVLHNRKTAHELLQSDNRPFACIFCGKCFTQASAMKAHQRIHTGERPFLCPVCGQTFNHRSNLTRHQKKMHNWNKSH